MNRERLKHLKQILLTVREQEQANELFDLNDWYHDRDRASTRIELPDGFCRTSACALGWAALDETFNEQGLRIRKDVCPVLREVDFEPEYTNPDDQECYDGFFAASEFFDIYRSVAHFLFDPYEYDVPNGKQNGKPMIDRVVKRIDWLLESYDSNTILREQLALLTVKDKRHLSIGEDYVFQI